MTLREVVEEYKECLCLTTENQHVINYASKSVLHLRTKKLVTASKRNHRGSFLSNNLVYFKAS